MNLMPTPSPNAAVKPPSVFLSYKRDAYPDDRLSNQIFKALNAIAADVFRDRQTIQPGADWEATIGAAIRSSDIFIAIVSKMSLTSPEVKKEILYACEQRKQDPESRPRIIPLTIKWKGPLPAEFAELDKSNRLEWNSAADTKRVVEKLRDMAAALHLERKAAADSSDAPEYEPYIERDCDNEFYRELMRPNGVTVALVGPMQTGKTLLLDRGKRKALEAGHRIIEVDLQTLEPDAAERKHFYQVFAATLRDKILELNEPGLEPEIPEILNAAGAAPNNCTGWLKKSVLDRLKQLELRILLVLDNLDAILLTPIARDFVSMLRSWHQLRFHDEWRRLGLILVAHNRIFTYLQMPTPFNVGTEIVLNDFCTHHLSHLNEGYAQPADDEDLALMEDLLGGHPYLSQAAFKKLSAAGRKNYMVELAKAACNEEGVFGHHLQLLRKTVFDQHLVDDLKRVLKDGRCAEDAFYQLQRHGLVRRTETAVEPRCRLYAQYFERVLHVEEP